MIRIALLFLFVFCFSGLSAQTIEGAWETYDDTSGKKRSIVSIYKRGDLFYGKIVKKFEGTAPDLCTSCQGDKHNKPILGMEIIEGLTLKGAQYGGGTITDPESGNVYKCYVELENDNKLKVRGFIGFSLLGRTQYWLRKK